MQGIRKDTALLCCLNRLIDTMISVTSQTRLKGGIPTNRNRSTENPESIRLNPKSRSNLAPKKRINGNCVNMIAVPLRIFSLSSCVVIFIVERHQFICITRNVLSEKPWRERSRVRPDFLKTSGPAQDSFV